MTILYYYICLTTVLKHSWQIGKIFQNAHLDFDNPFFIKHMYLQIVYVHNTYSMQLLGIWKTKTLTAGL